METVVLSDLHIGNNYRTCWYQQSIHEKYLGSVLDWIVAHANSTTQPVKRLIFLGDLFDFWTYPPDQKPPTLQDIINANQGIFGQTGKLCTVMNALAGNVYYVNGNHDINITQADLNTIPTGDNKIKMVPADPFSPVDTRMVYTHGHRYTMFNAPDPNHALPVGHFVTRAISYYVDHLLDDMPAGSTAANLHDQGSPYGFSLASFFPALAGQFSDPSITSMLLDYISDNTGMIETYPIKMADGTTTTIAQAKQDYNGLWTRWCNDFGGGERGATFAAKAAQADYNGDYLAWFALQDVLKNDGDGIVTGHTHHPKVGLVNRRTQYINCGFECPSQPDIDAGQTHFNFAYVDGNDMVSLMQVVKNGNDYPVLPANAPQDKLVYEPFMDFSCYVLIDNKSNSRLTLSNNPPAPSSGYFVVPPPAFIAPNSSVNIWLQDFAGIRGTAASLTYNMGAPGSRGDFTFNFGCPTGLDPNYATGGDHLFASSTTPPLTAKTNFVPATGYPLFVEYFVEQQPVTPPPDPNWRPSGLVGNAVALAGFDYDPTQDIIYSRKNPIQRLFGYAYGYDAAAPAGLSANIDCEPIFFEYNNKYWMIELWKGQYGMETGCEIGVYNRSKTNASVKDYVLSALDPTIGKRPGPDGNPDPVASHNLFYECASDNELLTLSLTLKKDGVTMFTRAPEPHWWLTGFKWGVYSTPEQLTMDLSITALDSDMYTALFNAVSTRNYTNFKADPTAKTISFTFDTPTTYQPRKHYALINSVNSGNQANVASYTSILANKHITSNNPNGLDSSVLQLALGGIVSYTSAFVAQAVADLAMSAAVAAKAMFAALYKGFQMLVDDVSYYVTQAGYLLSDWLTSLENFLGLNLDFSCVVEIRNGSQYDLVRDSCGANYGDFAAHPPQVIKAGGVGRFWLKDPKPSIHGADGWANYHYVDPSGSHPVNLSFDCPTGFSSNAVTNNSNGAFTFFAKSGDVSSAWGSRGIVPPGGHPLYVAFVWGTASAPSV